MAKMLSQQESAVLRAALECMPHGGTAGDLVWRVREAAGVTYIRDVPAAGVHRTAATLARKNLVARAGTSPQVYRITQSGRRALAGDRAGHWVARPATTER
jgi:hypothetical protein